MGQMCYCRQTNMRISLSVNGICGISLRKITGEFAGHVFFLWKIQCPVWVCILVCPKMEKTPRWYIIVMKKRGSTMGFVFFQWTNPAVNSNQWGNGVLPPPNLGNTSCRLIGPWEKEPGLVESAIISVLWTACCRRQRVSWEIWFRYIKLILDYGWFKKSYLLANTQRLDFICPKVASSGMPLFQTFPLQWLMQNTSLWPGHETRSGTTQSLKPGSWKKPRPLCPGLATFKGTQVDDL